MSETGKMILINLYHSQLEFGLGTHLLAERPDIAVSYLTPTWLTSICQFLFQHNLRITLTDATLPTLQTQEDQFIMCARYLSRFTVSQCYDINLVRLYLHASTLRDLSADNNGKRYALRNTMAAAPSHSLQPHFGHVKQFQPSHRLASGPST